MIVSRLIGGLGNQMFQYAAGRALSLRNQTQVKLDITGYNNQGGITKRDYELSIFNIKELFASEEEIRYLKSFSLKFCKKRVIKELGNGKICTDLLKARGDIYLDGYWQSEKYFLNFSDQIRNDFSFKGPYTGVNGKLIGIIKKVNSVSVHVRRADYVTDTNTNSFHGLCELRYYNDALNFISSKINNIKVFVFSDDHEWVKKNIKTKYHTIYISHNIGKSSWEDLRLMSKCKHNIIANSSFSWWGAWLNNNLNKIVVAPKKWFANSSIDTTDLCPYGWIRI